MPQVELVRRQTRKLVLTLGAVVVALVLLVGAGTWVYLQFFRDTKAETQDAQKQALLESFKGKHDAANQTLEKQLSVAKTDREKFDLYMAMGQNYMMGGKYKEAVGVYQEAAKFEPGFGTNEAIAKAADLAGDKALALDYYRRNRIIIKEGKAEQRAGDLERIEAAIVRLGGKL